MSIEEFEVILKELPNLKAPGVSGSRIKKLTELAISNVSDESKIVQKLYIQCKATPSTHKLGILYVIDSIVRAYVEECKKLNLSINEDANDGTFASGVYKISTIIENLIDDSMVSILDSKQREKIGKLVDIWERAGTFDGSIIKSIRSKYFKTTTPPGSPPPSIVGTGTTGTTRTTETTEINSNASNNVASNSNSGTNNNSPKPNLADPNAILQALVSLNGGNSALNSGGSGTTSVMPSSSNGSSLEQQKAAASAFLNNNTGNNNGNIQQPTNLADPNAIFNMLQQMNPHQPLKTSKPEPRRGRHEDNNNFSRRSRSRSPSLNNNSNNNINIINGNHTDDDFRQRETPEVYERNVPGTAHYRPRHFSYDNSIPAGSIKVMSRTLFIGGVPTYMDERELASVLRPYAEVQSVILNNERKHAFVKVYSRAEAESVIQSFNKNGNLALRTRWGVGFGPRDCCDYQHGVSIIPIARLTDADKRWIVSAEWGGTGGEPLVPGLCIDEPDIEIGAGVSSKAISRKMPTNSARNGPRSNRPGEPLENVVRASFMENNNFGNANGGNGNGFMSNNINNPLQNLFQPQQAGQPLNFNSPPQGSIAPNLNPNSGMGGGSSNVNSIMQSLAAMVNNSSSNDNSRAAPVQQQQHQQAPPQTNGLTPELAKLLEQMNKSN
ncbi:hypothetical protein PACTADRAFT_49930 [Pachysolen tannophilus NRRL Y-2460]|uniref:Protein NRD1 n=1 Tax=Pachysolen tannophilus NRRL Y-2460 TaxID=669874 RepID=A0A1E4TTV1_PACTA|nr:hypothetical protein PACTADRAFT_49930 [Pachysolen tannophilus NRRL Y-2460]